MKKNDLTFNMFVGSDIMFTFVSVHIILKLNPK